MPYINYNIAVNQAAPNSLKANYNNASNNIASSDVSIFSGENVENSDFYDLQKEFEEAKDKQGIIGKFWNGFKNLTGLGLSSDDVSEKLEKFEKGEITLEEAKSSIEKFEQKQNSMVDMISSMVSGLAVAVGVAASGGTSLVLSGVMGAAFKAGIKTLDRATNNIENDASDIKQIGKDVITGAVDGVITTATAGIGSACKTVAGGSIKGAIKSGAIQGAKQGVISGGVMGAANYSAEAIFEEDVDFSVEDLLKTASQSALIGGVMGGVIGGAVNGVKQANINKSLPNKLIVKHDKNLDAVIDNENQAKRYLDNYNQNQKDVNSRITGEDAYTKKAGELSEFSKKAQTLTKEYDSQIDEAAKQVNAVFSDKSNIEVITARAKSQDSIFSKLSSKNLNKGEALTTMDKCYDAIGDALGTRVQIKSLDDEVAKNIVDDILKERNISATFDDYVNFLQGGENLSKTTKEALEGVSGEILAKLKTEQTQNAVNQMVKAIEKGKLQITEINNYGDDLTSYFTDEQLEQLVAARDRAISANKIKTDKQFKIINKRKLANLSDVEGNPSNISFNTDKAVKESGYASFQANVEHSLKGGKKGYGELQLRGTRLNEFADAEHIPYDIRTGKIYADDPRYQDIFKIIKEQMSKQDYENYNKYLADTYKSLRMQELGLFGKTQKMPDIAEYLKGGNVQADKFKLLNMEGLIEISNRHV